MKIDLEFSIDVPDGTDPQRVLEEARKSIDSEVGYGGLCQWGNWDVGEAELASAGVAEVWIVLAEYPDGDDEALPFSSEERAVEAARAKAGHDGVTPDEFPAFMHAPGLVLLIPHSEEGGRVRVIKRAMDSGR